MTHKGLTISDHVTIRLDLSAVERPSARPHLRWTCDVGNANASADGATYSEARRKAVAAALRTIADQIAKGDHLG